MDRSSLVWRKSSASGHGHNCVEVAFTAGAASRACQGGGPRLIMVRDSKHPDGPVLTVTEASWQSLVTKIKNGEPGRPG